MHKGKLIRKSYEDAEGNTRFKEWRAGTESKPRPIQLKTRKGVLRRELNDAERTAILSMSGDGQSAAEIARTLKRNAVTVSKVINEARELTKKLGIPSTDWRETMQGKAIVAINAGLDATDDPYRRATVGLSAAKGLGILEQDAALSVVNLLNGIPAEHRDRYVSLDEPVNVTPIPEKPAE